MDKYEPIDGKHTVGFNYSVEAIQVEPVVDEYPIPSLVIKEQPTRNGEPSGEPTYYLIPEEYLTGEPEPVQELMKKLASERKTMMGKVLKYIRSRTDDR